MSSVRTAVVTIVAGRHEHLRRQQQGLIDSTLRPDHHVVVSMGDPLVRTALRASPVPTTVLDLPPLPRLPLAQARNLGADHALSVGTELLIFLDVDCIPSSTLVQRYADAAGTAPDDLLCGPVRYLPPPGPDGYPLTGLALLAEPHPARPAPAPETTLTTTDYDLFWSLSFAVTAPTWRTIGGFCEAYVGYGGEDTDFARQARALHIGMRWIGGAEAFHQHHPVSAPPVEHLDDILVNARIFHRRWGSWPMTGWLRAFERDDLIEYRTATDEWARTVVQRPVSTGEQVTERR